MLPHNDAVQQQLLWLSQHINLAASGPQMCAAAKSSAAPLAWSTCPFSSCHQCVNLAAFPIPTAAAKSSAAPLAWSTCWPDGFPPPRWQPPPRLSAATQVRAALRCAVLCNAVPRCATLWEVCRVSHLVCCLQPCTSCVDAEHAASMCLVHQPLPFFAADPTAAHFCSGTALLSASLLLPLQGPRTASWWSTCGHAIRAAPSSSMCARCVRSQWLCTCPSVCCVAVLS